MSWMHDNHEARILETIAAIPNCSMLEIGGGESTRVWARKLREVNGTLRTIETDEDWYKRLVDLTNGCDNLQVSKVLDCEDIKALLEHWCEYDCLFDVVLIDSVAKLAGKHLRPFCLQAVHPYLRDDGASSVFLHDAEHHLFRVQNLDLLYQRTWSSYEKPDEDQKRTKLWQASRRRLM